MLEILQFYVSSFWVWVGITVGFAIIIQSLFVGISELFSLKITKGK